MAFSLPSREVYAIDIPNVRDFSAEFQYNYFVPDESVNETGEVPSAFLARPASQDNSSFVQYATTRSPRMVVFKWSIPKAADVGNVVSDASIRTNALKAGGIQNRTLIIDNLSKLVSEDAFASNNFVALSFNDARIDDKAYELISGSFSVRTSLSSPAGDHESAATLLATSVPGTHAALLTKALSNPSRGAGLRFFQSGTPTSDAYFDGLKSVTVHVQANAKLLPDIVDRVVEDATSQRSSDMADASTFARRAKQSASQNVASMVSESDYKTFVPFIDVSVSNAAFNANGGIHLVGYIIDKVETLPDGTTKAHPPIVVDDPHVGTSIDFRVKYGSTYAYTCRVVAVLDIPAIDDTTGDVAMVKCLISGRPSGKHTITAIDLVAPPPPSDINIRWDYERDKLVMSWAFPPNSQRDIKKFQVFRRSSIDEPFELQKEYDFDDSVKPTSSGEQPDPRLVEVINNPIGFWTDDGFNRDVLTSQERSYIYALACIDAHGLTSPMSMQLRVWFDRFSNSLQRQLVSHQGAPKSYPNLYVSSSPFTNTVKVSGKASRSLKLYFNPEFYSLTDDSGRTSPAFQTQQAGGRYVFNIVNLDTGTGGTINVGIDDRRTHGDPIVVVKPASNRKSSSTNSG